MAVDGRQPGDRPAAARDDDLAALPNPLQMLTQAIVKLSDTHLATLKM